MDRIAVVLRGHIRTWSYNCEAVFKFYDSIAHNVDYYFVTWNTPNVRCSKVTDSFKWADKKITKYLEVEIPTHFYTSWAGPAYLSMMISPYVRQQHKINPYEAIFDSRPDVLVARTEYPVLPIADNTLYSTSFTNLIDRHGDRNVGMKDHMLVSKMDVYNTMIDRITIKSTDTKECHHDMLAFAKSQGFSVSNSLPWLKTDMTRPHDKLKCNQGINYHDKDIRNSDAWHNTKSWEEFSTQEKEALCEEQNIEKYDYITNNHYIAIESVSAEVLTTLTSR